MKVYINLVLYYHEKLFFINNQIMPLYLKFPNRQMHTGNQTLDSKQKVSIYIKNNSYVIGIYTTIQI